MHEAERPASRPVDRGTHEPRHGVAVVIPAYNEEATVAATLREFHQHLPEASLFVVDNNSSDGTAECARRTIDDLGVVGAVLSEPRQGKSLAVRHAFHAVDADVYLMVDADLTYPASAARTLIDPILRGQADMVVGDRRSTGAYRRENRRRFHGVGNHLVTSVIRWTFGGNLRDIMSGYRAMSRRFVKTCPILSSRFELETELSLHGLDKRLRVLEVPIEYRNRRDGTPSKLNTFSDGFRVLRTILHVFRYYRPLAFFGLVAGVFLVSGVVVGTPVILEYVEYRYVYAIPKAILATGLVVISVILLSIGVVLDSVIRVHELDFEQRFLAFKE